MSIEQGVVQKLRWQNKLNRYIGGTGNVNDKFTIRVKEFPHQSIMGGYVYVGGQ